MSECIWICDECGTEIPFRKPELPANDYRSEQNESKSCPSCNAGMWFDDISPEEEEEDQDFSIDVSILTLPPVVAPVPTGDQYPEGYLEAPHGWLDTNGIYYHCLYGGHEEIAEFGHSEKVVGFELKGWHDTFSRALERYGWIKIQSTNIFYPDHVKMDDAFPVTAKQFRFINDFLSHHKVESMYCYDFRVRG